MTKLSIETVVEGLTLIAVNYTLEASEAYQDLIFEQLKDKLSEEEFNKACKAIIFQESISYNKMPNVGVFIKHASKQELDPKEQAEIEAERIIETASYPCPVLFDNKTTNAAVGSYGGIGKVYHSVHDSFNPNRKSDARHWVKKELVNIWLSCHAAGKTSNKPSFPAISSKSDPIAFVGDEAKCRELLGSSIKLLEEPKNDEMDKIIEKLAEGWKNK